MATITSAQTGPWSETSTWSGGVVPGNGDSAIIAATHNVTVDQDTTIGTSDVADTGTAAITVNTGGTLTIGAFRLTSRGDIDLSACNNTTRGLDGLAGGSVLFDDTQAAGSESYRLITPSQYPGTQPAVRIRGTAVSRFTLGIVASGTYARIAGSGVNYFGLLDAEYCDIENFGDASTDANALSAPSDGDNNGSVLRLISCIFTNCGKFNATADGNHSQITLQSCSFKSSAGTRSLGYSSYVQRLGSGIRSITGCVFDKHVDLFAPRDLTLSQNFFGQGYTTSNTDSEGWTSSNLNFVQADNSFEEFVPRGDVTDEFWYHSYVSKVNPHLMFVRGDNQTSEQTVRGVIFEAATSDNNGDCMLVGNKSIATTINIRQCIGLPNAGGDCSGTLLSALGDINFTISVENCTHFCGSQTGIAVGETYVGHAGMFSSIRGNIFHDTSARGYKVADSGTNDNVPDLVASGDIDFNCGFNLLAGSNLKGYNNLEFSSGAPGANDVDVDPAFRDRTRDLASWDASLGGPGTAANAVAELQKRNDADFNSEYTVSNLLTYVRDGFAPTATQLRGADQNAGTIGAVEFYSPPPAQTCIANRSEYVLLGTNRLARMAQAITAAGSTDGTIENLFFASSSIFWERETAGTQSRIEFDLGSGASEVAHYLYVRGVELFQNITGGAGASTIKLFGSNNNFVSEAELLSIDLQSSAVGTYDEDLIAYDSTITTPFRYFAVQIDSANSVQHILRKVFFGEFVDFGRDPSYPYSANLRQDQRAFASDAGTLFKTSSGRRPLDLEFGWKGIADSVRNSLINQVQRYTNDSPVFLYQPSGSSHSPLCDYTTVCGWASFFQETVFWKNINLISMTMREDIVG